MKGIVFTEFLEMVEDQFGWDVADDLLETANLPSGGVYTAVGTYDVAEFIALVSQLSRRTGRPTAELLQSYGQYLFGRFVEGYPHLFETTATTFDFLHAIENHIHVEVRKLYPDAELPHFDYSHPDTDTLIMTYHSTRPLAHFAEGLLKGCLDHFGEPIDLTCEYRNEQHTQARFVLTKRA